MTGQAYAIYFFAGLLWCSLLVVRYKVHGRGNRLPRTRRILDQREWFWFELFLLMLMSVGLVRAGLDNRPRALRLLWSAALLVPAWILWIHVWRKCRRRREAAGLGKAAFSRWAKIVGVILLVYVGSYYALSRYSLWQMKGLDVHGFYYAPVSVERVVSSRAWSAVHRVGRIVYAPVWFVDYHVFGGPTVVNLPMTRIGVRGPPTSTCPRCWRSNGGLGCGQHVRLKAEGTA